MLHQFIIRDWCNSSVYFSPLVARPWKGRLFPKGLKTKMQSKKGEFLKKLSLDGCGIANMAIFCPRPTHFCVKFGILWTGIFFAKMHIFAVVIASEMLSRTVLVTCACGLWKCGDYWVLRWVATCFGLCCVRYSVTVTVLKKADSSDGQKKMYKYMYIYLLYI